MDFKTIADNLGLDEEDIVEVAQLFIQTAPGEIERLVQAQQHMDAKLAAEAAHSIKGSSSTLGLDETAKLAQIVVKQGREKDLAGLKSSLPRLIQELQHTVASLSRQIQGRTA